MKNIFKISGVILLIILIHSCKKDKPTPPVITTTDVTAISYTTAISGGDVTNDGGAAMVFRGVCWNTSADPTIDNSKTLQYGGLGSFISNITLLTPNTMYYLRAYATNSVGTAYGNQVSFTTSPVEVPVLTTAEITSVAQKTAGSGGNITDDKGGSVTARGVCWSTSPNPTVTLSTKTSDYTGKGVFTSSITGLTAGIKYYVRAYATNSEGTAYGNEISFTTNPPTLPVLTTTDVPSIITTTAKSGGNVTDDGGVPTTVRGLCWSTSPNPTPANNTITDNGTGIGSYTSTLTGLVPNTTYYLRAYAINSVGTSYGNELMFKTFAVIDIDGRGYNSVTIGAQIWMGENLKTSKYSNGDLIGTTTPATLDLTNESTPKYQWAYQGNESNVATYGRLYTWYTVTDSRNICPTGWHIPTDAEWTVLENYLIANGYNYDGTTTDNKIAKSLASATGWTSLTTTGAVGNNDFPAKINATGFTALPGGSRNYNGTFLSTIYYGFWWSASEGDATNAWYRSLYSSSINLRSLSYNKKIGFSVRCLKD